MSIWFVSLAAFAYLAILFLVAQWADRNAGQPGTLGERVFNSPLVYTLSIAVYCTSWTFFGAVGTASRDGLEFMAIYLGPSLVFFGWVFLLRKLARISRSLRITSIADFISSRFGKSQSIAALVTVVAMIATTPYIALQLKAVALSFEVLTGQAGVVLASTDGFLPTDTPMFFDTALLVIVAIGGLTLLFGTRHLNANERHAGIVAAIAFESLVKLIAFVSIGVFVVWGINGSPSLLLQSMANNDTLEHVFTLTQSQYGRWVTLLIISAIAAICLPRQFQVTVVENEAGDHLRSAAWMFPLYLFVLCLFVVPIAWTGLNILPDNADPDLFVLTLPLSQGNQFLALLAFIGGFSSATSMIIIACVVLALMICNHIVVPLLVRAGALDPLRSDANFSRALLNIRRGSIVVVLLLGYFYLQLSEDTAALASIGLISFAGAAQLLPAIVSGVFWRRATANAAFAAISVGTIIWAYTLLLPAIERSGVPLGLLSETGPLGLSFLNPEGLLGISNWDSLTHSLFFSLSINFLILIAVSNFSIQSRLDRQQAHLFVSTFELPEPALRQQQTYVPSLDELRQLSERFLGSRRTTELFQSHDKHRGSTESGQTTGSITSPPLTRDVERALAGNLGAASARVIVKRLAQSQDITHDEAIQILDEAQQLALYSQQLEDQRQALSDTASKLVKANARLTEIDRNKDEFLRQISHELRTPLTSVRSFASILESNDNIPPETKARYLGIIRTETERLTRMLEGMLIQRRVEDNVFEFNFVNHDPNTTLEKALRLVEAGAVANGVAIRVYLDVPTAQGDGVTISADADALNQVFLNVLSNAIKFADKHDPVVNVSSSHTAGKWQVVIQDNGPGLGEVDPFAQDQPSRAGRWIGAGMGLRVSQTIMKGHRGHIAISNDDGAKVTISLPIADDIDGTT